MFQRKGFRNQLGHNRWARIQFPLLLRKQRYSCFLKVRIFSFQKTLTLFMFFSILDQGFSSLFLGPEVALNCAGFIGLLIENLELSVISVLVIGFLIWKLNSRSGSCLSRSKAVGFWRSWSKFGAFLRVFGVDDSFYGILFEGFCYVYVCLCFCLSIRIWDFWWFFVEGEEWSTNRGVLPWE